MNQKQQTVPFKTTVLAPLDTSSAAPAEDVTVLQQAYRELEQRCRSLTAELDRLKPLAALGERIALVAHELRNPLGGIAGFAAILDHDLPENDPRKPLIGKILAGIEQLNRMAEGLLHRARGPEIRPSRFDAVQFLEDITVQCETELRSAGRRVILRRDFPEKTLPVDLDPEYFRQAVTNLLANSFQAVGEEGEVRVSANLEPSEPPTPRKTLVVKVQDNGPGMTPELLQKIFTPFFTTKTDGSGLGLAIVRQAAQAHGGEVAVTSAPGKGATFTLRIPQDVQR